MSFRTLSIKDKHYSIWPIEFGDYCQTFSTRLEKQFDDLSCETVDLMASIFEYWEWQERQSKFIVNSVRAYEYWGYEWRVPFWDNEVMEYWRRVPLKHRIGKSLYDRYVDSIFEEWHVNFQKPQDRRNLWTRMTGTQSFWNFFTISERLSCYKLYSKFLATNKLKDYSHVFRNVRVNAQLAYDLLHQLEQAN